MPSVTGDLIDNRIDLASDVGQALADLPFDAYYIDNVTFNVPAAIVSQRSVFVVKGRRWTPIVGLQWRAVRGRPWRSIGGPT